MLKEITISLPQSIFSQAEQLAKATQRNIVDVLVDSLSESFTPTLFIQIG